MASALLPQAEDDWRRRVLIRVAAVAACAVGVLLLGAAPAPAHLSLTSSDPVSAAALSRAPTDLQLRFSETVDPEFVTVALTSNNKPVSLGEPRPDAATVSQPVPILPDGPYVLAYRIVSRDGHVVSGRITFTIARLAMPTPPSSAHAPAPALAVAPTAAPSPATASSAQPMSNEPAEGGEGLPLWVWVVLVIILSAAVISIRRLLSDPG